jgi:hypothetical protein
MTQLLSPDNLKSAVTKAHRYDPTINQAYTRLIAFTFTQCHTQGVQAIAKVYSLKIRWAGSYEQPKVFAI